MRLYLYVCYAQGALAQYLRAIFGQKENFPVYLSRKNAIIIPSKHGTTVCFFSYCNLFQGKLKEELVRKTRVNSERVYRIVLMPPGHPIILLKSH